MKEDRGNKRGKYKIKEKNIIKLNKFYEKIKKEWQQHQV